jgi:hypothetical protein
MMRKRNPFTAGRARNPSVTGNSPYVPVTGNTFQPEVQKPTRFDNGVRQHNVGKSGVISEGARKLWKPNGYLPVRIHLKKRRGI